MQVVHTDTAPKAVGPYSQAIIANGFIFISGQIAIDPETGSVMKDDTACQTKQVLKNLTAILESVGSNLNKVVKTTVFLTSMNDFESMNKVYAEFFQSNKPARATIEVSRLPKDVSVEIEAVALV